MGCFSCLGSICEKICGSCSVDTVCNCSKTQTIVIADRDAAPQIIDALNRGERIDLREIIRRSQHPGLLEPVEKPANSMIQRITVAADDDQYEDTSIAAIYLIAKKMIGESMRRTGNYADSWTRFETANHLAEVNLNERLNARRPISSDELVLLDQKIDEINKYGSMAADLLERLCACRGDWDQLEKQRTLPRDLVRYLARNLSPALFQQEITFSELNFPTQVILINVVKKFYSKMQLRSHLDAFTAWAREPVLDAPPRVIEFRLNSDPESQPLPVSEPTLTIVSESDGTDGAAPI